MSDSIGVTIYKLIDPSSLLVYYVGRTKNELNKRYLMHLNSSLTKKEEIYSKWRELRALGIELSIEAIESTLILYREQYWINYYIQTGHPICNSQNSYNSQIAKCKYIYDKEFHGGRKPVEDKKEAVTIYIERSIIRLLTPDGTKNVAIAAIRSEAEIKKAKQKKK